MNFMFLQEANYMHYDHKGYDEQRVKNGSYLSEPARSTKFSRPNRIFISAFCCHCIENMEQADGHFALML